MTNPDQIIERIDELSAEQHICEKDEISKFIFDNGYKDEIINLRQELFDYFIKVCKDFGLEYVSINKNEVLGDNSRYYGWPTIWEVSKKAGIGKYCGNPNQHQTLNLLKYFPDEVVGYMWDVNKKEIMGSADTLITGKHGL